MQSRVLRLLFISLLSVLGFDGATTRGQQRAGYNTVDAAALIDKLDDENERSAAMAAQHLIRMGPEVIPALRDRMRTNKRCQFQWVASGIIYSLNRQKDLANPVLTDIALGRCEGSSSNDRRIRRQAAFALVTRVEGVPLVAQMLSHKETFTRQSAAFAFDELTEKLAGGRPDRIEATAPMIDAVKAALPALAKGMGDKDEVVRCMSYEALEQAQRLPDAILRTEATRLVQGVSFRCSK